VFEYEVVVCFVFYRDFKDTFWSGEIVGSGLVGGVVERGRERGEKERRAAVATAVRCGAVRCGAVDHENMASIWFCASTCSRRETRVLAQMTPLPAAAGTPTPGATESPTR